MAADAPLQTTPRKDPDGLLPPPRAARRQRRVRFQWIWPGTRQHTTAQYDTTHSYRNTDARSGSRHVATKLPHRRPAGPTIGSTIARTAISCQPLGTSGWEEGPAAATASRSAPLGGAEGGGQRREERCGGGLGCPPVAREGNTGGRLGKVSSSLMESIHMPPQLIQSTQ